MKVKNNARWLDLLLVVLVGSLFAPNLVTTFLVAATTAFVAGLRLGRRQKYEN